MHEDLSALKATQGNLDGKVQTMMDQNDEKFKWIEQRLS